MLYTTIEINEKEYKCRLGAKECVDLERRLGANPLNLFLETSKKEQLPSIELLVSIFHASLNKYHHEIKLADAYKIYDDYVDEGHTLEDFIPFIMEIFEVSGFFKAPKEEEGKN